MDCGPLADPVGGNVSFTTTTYLSLAMYQCIQGYEGPSTTRQCDVGGWSGSEPTCTRKFRVQIMLTQCSCAYGVHYSHLWISLSACLYGMHVCVYAYVLRDKCRERIPHAQKIAAILRLSMYHNGVICTTTNVSIVKLFGKVIPQSAPSSW